MKRLDQVSSSRCIDQLPYTIDEPGTYEVCGNLQGESGVTGITITSSNVVLDLAGFTLQGATGSRDAIHVSGSLSNVTIRNGTVQGWGGDGVNARSSDDLWCWGLSVRACGGDGIAMGGGGVAESRVSGNGGNGISIRCPDGSCARPPLISDVSSSGNGGDGITCTDSSLRLERCVTNDNTGNGVSVYEEVAIKPIRLELARCESSGNGGSGISSRDVNLQIDTCLTEKNTLHGIHQLLTEVTGDGTKAQNHNSSRSNRTSGISSGGNGGSGILIEVSGKVDAEFSISDSNLSSNGDTGVSLLPASAGSSGVDLTLERCVTSRNSSSGVHVQVQNSPPTLSSCVSSGNGGHGVHLRFDELSSGGTKAPAPGYNNSRSNRSTIVGNTGNGLFVEVDGAVDVSLTLEDSKFCGNGDNGVSVAGLSSSSSGLRLTLDRCEASRNATDGIFVDNNQGALPLAVCVVGGTDCDDNGRNGMTCPLANVSSLDSCSFSSNGTSGLRLSGGSGVVHRDIAARNLVVSGNASHGVDVTGEITLEEGREMSMPLDDSTISGNGGHGVRVSVTGIGGSSLSVCGTGSRFTGSSQSGIHVEGPVSVCLDRCEVSSNGSHGVAAVSTLTEHPRRVELRSCSVGDNDGDGLHVDARIDSNVQTCLVSVVDTVCFNNSSSGIRAFTEACVVRSSVCSSNGDRGIFVQGNGVGGWSVCVDVVASSNAAAGIEKIELAVEKVERTKLSGNGGNGMTLSSPGTVVVSDCPVSGNTGNGIEVVCSSGQFTRCVVSDNDGDGMHLTGDGLLVLDNSVSGHNNGSSTAMGVRVTGGGTTLRGNTFVSNDRASSLADDTNPLYEASGIRGENVLYNP